MWELEAEFDSALRAEQEAEAAAILAAARASVTLRDQFRSVAPGDVVTVVATDGLATTGRILGVGADVVTLGETPDPWGARRLDMARIHHIPLRAVVRLITEARP
jgi:hypothetical protein